MKNEKLLKALEALESLLEIKNNVSDEDEEYSEELKSLQSDYEAFMKWALGQKAPMTKSHCLKLWKNLHPHLPIPRVFTIDEDIKCEMAAITLVMDAYHLYLKEKEDEKCNCVDCLNCFTKKQ